MDKAAREKARERLSKISILDENQLYLEAALDALDAADMEIGELRESQMQIAEMLGLDAATRLNCQDAVNTMNADNARLQARVSELEAALARIVDRANEHSPGPTPDRETVYAIHAIAMALPPAPPVGDR